MTLVSVTLSLCHSACFQGSLMLYYKHVLGRHSFSLPNNIPRSGASTFRLSIHPSVDMELLERFGRYV